MSNPNPFAFFEKFKSKVKSNIVPIVSKVLNNDNLVQGLTGLAMRKGGRVQPSGRIKPQDVMKNYNMMLNHLMGHIEDYNEPIDPKDYKQSKVLINSIRKLKKNKPKKKRKSKKN